MNNHPYLRAYMAGISVPTPLLLVALTLFSIARFVYNSGVVPALLQFTFALEKSGQFFWSLIEPGLRDKGQPPD